MEQHKFEQQLKEQVNAREIIPSEMAWNKLDAMLSVAEKPKSKFPWMYVAASIVGLITIGTFYYNGSTATNKEKVNPVVFEEKEIIDTVNDSQKLNESVLPSQIQKPITRHIKFVAENNSSKKQPVQVNKHEPEHVKINRANENEAAVNRSENTKNQSINGNKYISAEQLLAEVTNTAYEPKANDNSYQKSKTAIAVNPSTLLENTEKELNQSFRESALRKLNKNITVIKTALANRNYTE